MSEQEYEAELDRLRKRKAANEKTLEELVKQNEEDYCEIVAERIIQWENSGTICERDITIHRLRRELEILKSQ